MKSVFLCALNIDIMCLEGFQSIFLVLNHHDFSVSQCIWIYWCYDVSITFSGVGFNHWLWFHLVQDSELVWQCVELLWLRPIPFLSYLGHSAVFAVWGGLYLGPHVVQPDIGNVLLSLLAILRRRSKHWAESHYDLKNGKKCYGIELILKQRFCKIQNLKT